MARIAFILGPLANSSSIPAFLVDPTAVVIDDMTRKRLYESPHSSSFQELRAPIKSHRLLSVLGGKTRRTALARALQTSEKSVRYGRNAEGFSDQF